MLFDDQQVFSYEKRHFATGSIRDLYLADDGTVERFALSGLADYQEALFITKEWYESSYPALAFKEMRSPQKTPMDTLYNEPLSRHKDFDRILTIPAKIEQEKVSIKRSETGPERKQGIRIWLGIMNLMGVNYWPRVGDEFTYRNVLHEVSLVHIDPADYWQQSGWPIHVSIVGRQVQFGDWGLSGRPHETLKDTGAGDVPSTGEPAAEAPVSAGTTPGDVTSAPNVQAAGSADGMTPNIPSTPYIDLPPPDAPYC